MDNLVLTPRLKCVYDLASGCDCIADIGTDHAYLPTKLLLDGKVNRAYASDMNKGPLDRAKLTAKNYNVEDKMSFFLGNGLTPLRGYDFDCCAICGMGGEIISAILEAGRDIIPDKCSIILQPMSSIPELRMYLNEHGFSITKETIVKEKFRFYLIFEIVRGYERVTKTDILVGKQSEDCYIELREEYLVDQLRRMNRALNGLENSISDFYAEKREQQRMERDLVFSALEQWQSWFGMNTTL